MELGDKIADNVMNNVKELPAETRRILRETTDQVSEFVHENQVLVLIGASLLAGVAGFFLGRAYKND